MYDEKLLHEVNESAEKFSKSLIELASFAEDNFSQIVRKAVFDLFSSIVRRSPVDTGTYRASHGIANHNPSDNEGIVHCAKDKSEASMSEHIAETKVQAWTWRVGDGTIFIFNNLPYAEPLENGHSGQAPAGVYRQAMAEVEGFINKQIAALKSEIFT